MPKKKFNIYRNGKIHVMQEKCETCVFRPGNLMSLQPGRVVQMVRDATKMEGSIPCHDQLYKGADAVCRGFFDLHPTQPLQIADRLGLIKYVKGAK